MKQIQLLILFIAGAVALQSCKKSNESAGDTGSTTSPAFQATINGATWTPDTTAATITYNAATKAKVLTLTGTKAQKRIVLAVTLADATNDDSFATATYSVNSANNVSMAYYTQQKDASGNYVFVQHGNAEVGSGSVILSTVDNTAKTVTGTFSFTSTHKTYASNGDLVSIDVANITAGQFNTLPYTFTSN